MVSFTIKVVSLGLLLFEMGLFLIEMYFGEFHFPVYLKLLLYSVITYSIGDLIEYHSIKPLSRVQRDKRQKRINNDLTIIIALLIILTSL